VNEQLYRSHLNNANTWNATWTNLQQHINENLQPETEALYNKLNKKIDNLIYKQTIRENTQTTKAASSFLSMRNRRDKHKNHKRRTRNTGLRTTIQPGETHQNLLDEPHYRDRKSYKTTG
jgi:hypothetical protein